MGAVFSVEVERSAQALEGLFALYLPTPEQSGLVINSSVRCWKCQLRFKLTSTCLLALAGSPC